MSWSASSFICDPCSSHRCQLAGSHFLRRCPTLHATKQRRTITKIFAQKEAVRDAPAASKIGGLMFGYDIGATSGALVSLTGASTSGTDWYNLGSFESGLVVSISLLGALAGSLVTLAAGNRLGRKTELLGAAALYGASSLVMATAANLPLLLAGRFGYGLGIGFAMHAAPAYIAETSPPSVRGLLISLKEVGIVLGILLGYVLSYATAEQVGGWRTIYLAGAPMAAILGLGMATLCESPRWLMLNGCGIEEVKQAIVRAEGSRANNEQLVNDELALMADSVKDQPSSSNPIELAMQPRYMKPLLVGTSLMLFQQITGQPSVLYYAARMFEEVGFNTSDAEGVAVIVGLFKLVTNLLAVAKVDSWGRRPLLLTGVSGMVVALCALAAAQAGQLGDLGPWFSVAALLMYVGCYQISFGPIAWLIVGEVFPLTVRSQAIAAATFVNFGSNFLVSLVLPSVEEQYGLAATYLGFALIGLVALASMYLTVPETKGRSLEEIEAMWQPKQG